MSDMRSEVGVRTAALIGAVGLAAMAVYQLVLAAGAPLGEAAWGGTHEGQLPTTLRIGSGVSIAVYAIAVAVILQRSGLSHLRLPRVLDRIGSWVLVALLTLGTMANFLSQSQWERFLLGPITLLLAGACLVVAIGPRHVPEPTPSGPRPQQGSH
jgi:hypothetical protein